MLMVRARLLRTDLASCCSPTMQFTLHQLRVFVAVAESGSVTRAAEALHLTQPAASVQLRNFQQCFDGPLVEWAGRTMHLTDLGRRVLHSAKEMLMEAERMQAQTNASRGEWTGKISIASVSTGKYLLPRFLRDFNAQHPHVAFELEVTNRQKVLAALAAGQIDYAFVSLPPDRLQVHSVKLLPNRLHWVAPADWQMPTDDGEALTSWLADSALIFRESGSGTRHVMGNALRARGIAAQPLLELATNEAVKQAVVAGMGISLMAEAGFQSELRLGMLQSRPIAWDGVSQWQLIRLETKPLTPLRDRFESQLSARAHLLAQRYFPFASSLRPIGDEPEGSFSPK